MLKLIDQNLLSTKTDYNYWKYSMHSDAISRHIEWITENIENSKDGHIRIRVNDLDSKGFGYITEVLIAKFLGIETRFDIYRQSRDYCLTGNFNYRKFDMYQHEDFGRIFHDKNCYYWKFNTKKNKTLDFFFCIGYNESRTEVLCVYIIPNENILNNTIRINKNWDNYDDPYYWDRQDPKSWNDLFHILKLEDCPVLKTRS